MFKHTKYVTADSPEAKNKKQNFWTPSLFLDLYVFLSYLSTLCVLFRSLMIILLLAFICDIFSDLCETNVCLNFEH